MYISSRVRNLLDVLLSSKQQVWTVQKLAEKLDVSTRTVHRDLNQLPSLLKRYDLQLQKQAGLGTFIDGETVQKEALQKALVSFTTEYSPEERKWVLVIMLLNSIEPQKLAVLARTCQVTPVTISQDLKQLEEWFAQFDLQIVKRRSWGIVLEGDEQKKRRAMSSFITEQFSEEHLLQLLFHREEHVLQNQWKINPILQLLQQEIVRKVAHMLSPALKILPYQLADHAYMMLIVHFVLAIQRMQKNQFIDQIMVNRIPDTPENKTIEMLAGQIEKNFQIKIPEAERAYFFSLLKGAKISSVPKDDFDPMQQEYYLQAKQLLEAIKNQLNEEMMIDQELVQDLSVHLERAIFRLQHDRGIYNPLLTDLKNRYRDAFKIVQKAVDKVFPQYQFPDDEIGYLVMHVASLLEPKEKPDSLQALVVCASGIGTSKWLYNRLAKEFPEITELKYCSLQELQQMKVNADLVISTISLPADDYDYLKVSPFLSDEDVNTIRNYLQHVSKSKQTTKSNQHIRDNRLLPYIRDWTSTIMTLIKGCIQQTLVGTSLENSVEEICQKLLVQKRIQADRVCKQLLKRNQLGGLGIPGTQFALLHTRSDEVRQPSFTFYDLHDFIQIKGMDEKWMPIKRLFVLLAPLQITTTELEALSWVSSLLVESEENMQIFDKGSIKEIRSLLQSKANQYLYEKVQR